MAVGRFFGKKNGQQLPAVTPTPEQRVVTVVKEVPVEKVVVVTKEVPVDRVITVEKQIPIEKIVTIEKEVIKEVQVIKEVRVSDGRFEKTEQFLENSLKVLQKSYDEHQAKVKVMEEQLLEARARLINLNGAVNAVHNLVRQLPKAESKPEEIKDGQV